MVLGHAILYYTQSYCVSASRLSSHFALYPSSSYKLCILTSSSFDLKSYLNFSSALIYLDYFSSSEPLSGSALRSRWQLRSSSRLNISKLKSAFDVFYFSIDF